MIKQRGDEKRIRRSKDKERRAGIWLFEGSEGDGEAESGDGVNAVGEEGILSEDGIEGEAAEVEGFFDRGGGMGVAGMEQGFIGEQS